MNSRLRLVAITVALSLAAAACGAAQTPVQPAGQGTSVVASEPSTTESLPSDSPPAEETAPAEDTTPETNTYSFGQTATFDDGMHVTVGKPVPFKPGEYAAWTEGFTKFVKFRITIENRSGKVFDPSMASMTVMSGETEGSEVFDSEHNLGGSPDTKLLNGRKVTYTAGFGVKNSGDLVVEYNLSWEHEAVMYSSTGK